jgi:hypothetical protein
MALTGRVLQEKPEVQAAQRLARLSCPSGRLEYDRPVPLTEHQTSAASGVSQFTPIGFLPLRCFNRLSPHIPGFAAPGSFHFQVFPTS